MESPLVEGVAARLAVIVVVEGHKVAFVIAAVEEALGIAEDSSDMDHLEHQLEDQHLVACSRQFLEVHNVEDTLLDSKNWVGIDFEDTGHRDTAAQEAYTDYTVLVDMVRLNEVIGRCFVTMVVTSNTLLVGQVLEDNCLDNLLHSHQDCRHQIRALEMSLVNLMIQVMVLMFVWVVSS